MERRVILLWTGLALIGVDLLFFSGASNFLASPQSRILNQLLVLAVMAGLGVAVARGAVDLRTALILPGVAWVVANIASAALSVRPATAAEALALLLLCAPAYLAVRAVTWAPQLRPRLDRLLVGAALVFVVAYLLQALGQWVTWWSVAGPSVPPLRPGDVGLTVGTVNAVSLYLELLVPIAAWLAWTTWRARRAAALIAILGVAALVVTGSRGAWLGALVGGIVFAGLLWQVRGRPMPALPSGASRPVILVGAAVIVVVGALVAPVLLARMFSGDAGRLELWAAAWSMFTAHPLTGVGPGAYPLVRPESLISEPNLAVLTTSHNSVLQVLAETGLLGMLAAGWATVAAGRLAARAVASAPDRDEQVLRLIVVGSLLAMAVHSLVDTQFHLPAVMLMIFLLLARLDPPSTAISETARSRRAPLAVGAACAALAVVALVPIDVAMVRADLGSQELDRGDAGAALEDFRSAAGLHELATYRLGEGLAAARLGDDATAAAAFGRAASLHPLTFIWIALATVSPAERAAVLEKVASDGPYDATAAANSAVLRYPDDVTGATEDLAAAMAGGPTLIFSERPESLFDDATWLRARRQAIEEIGGADAVTAAVVATLAGEADLAARYRAAVEPGPEAEALDLLAAAAGGAPDVGRARALLREATGSPQVQAVLWQMGFEALSQPLLDDVRALSVTAYFGLPLPPMELVIGGRIDADWSMRLPRWPMASDVRRGPDRPYAIGMVTIEPVFRPKP